MSGWEVDRPVGRSLRGLVLLQLRDGGVHLDQAQGAGDHRVHWPRPWHWSRQEEGEGSSQAKGELNQLFN